MRLPTLHRIEPPGGLLLAQKEVNSAPLAGAIHNPTLIEEKCFYANTITAPTSSTSKTNRQEREQVLARHTTHNGMPVVIFKAKDYYGVMAEDCKYTLVGRFFKSKPQIDKIRSRFKELITITGSVKIGVYDNFNIFIDLVNKEDCQNVWFKRVIEIEGMQLWL